MKCLNDGETMKTVTLYGVTVDICPVCNGIWLDGGELPHLTSKFVFDTTPDELGSLHTEHGAGVTPPEDFWKETQLHCPNDGQALKKHFFAGDSGVGIEHCHACQSFWLDGGELGEIWHYLKPNPYLDAAVRNMIRDQKEWTETLETVKQLPFHIYQFLSLAIASPPVALAIIAKPIFDVFIKQNIDVLNVHRSSSQDW